MAYGKIKADTLVYDNGGTDTDVTIASLGNKADTASPTFTGTVTIPTPSSGDNSTKAASTAFVSAGFAPIGGASFTGDISATNCVLSGNLTVNGTTTTVNSTNTTITDNLLELNSGAGSNANDSGIIIERGSTGDNAIFAWDESADKFIVGTTTGTASSTGDITITAGTLVTGTVEDSKGDVRSIPLNSKTSSYTLVASDAGKCIAITTGGVTVPDDVFNANGGDAVTIINNSGSDQTITQGSGVTLYNTADGSTGNRTLAGRGMATLLFTAVDNAYISGAGLS